MKERSKGDTVQHHSHTAGSGVRGTSRRAGKSMHLSLLSIMTGEQRDARSDASPSRSGSSMRNPKRHCTLRRRRPQCKHRRSSGMRSKIHVAHSYPRVVASAALKKGEAPMCTPGTDRVDMR